jgi:hypothetical protein
MNEPTARMKRIAGVEECLGDTLAEFADIHDHADDAGSTGGQHRSSVRRRKHVGRGVREAAGVGSSPKCRPAYLGADQSASPRFGHLAAFQTRPMPARSVSL